MCEKPAVNDLHNTHNTENKTFDNTRCESKGWLTTRAEAPAANPRNQSKYAILGAQAQGLNNMPAHLVSRELVLKIL